MSEERTHYSPAEHLVEHRRSFGQRAADVVTSRSGWWPSIIGYLLFTAVYLVVNHWFIQIDTTLQFYTFGVSVAAIFLAQVILLSQNRQSEIESKIAHSAYAQIGEIDQLQREQMMLLSQHSEQLALLKEIRDAVKGS